MDAIDRSVAPAKVAAAKAPVGQSEPLDAWANAPQGKSAAAPKADMRNGVFARDANAGA
jgi:hypothetical protein